VETDDGDNLLDVMRANGVDIDADCGGLGRCGKCVVVIGGERRLACRTFVDADMSVDIPRAGENYDILAGTGEWAGGNVTAGGEAASDTAIAVDIGTTTVVVKLIDVEDGRELWASAELNGQRAYGADVISRIEASMDDASALSGVITEQVNGMIAAMLRDSGTAADSVRRVVVAGNTAMCYLLLDLPCRSLGLAPFRPAFTFQDEYGYGEIFHTKTPDCPVLVMPFISAYVGGDITAGLLTRESPASGVGESGGPAGSYMLVDMGTNGEIAYRAGERILCTSTAAGPAFEGGNISCGSGSVEGAVSRVRMRDGAMEYETIGGAPARSVCGSGLLDAMACFVREGVVDTTGAMNADAPYVGEGGVVIAGADVVLTQRDVREFQLAKSAVRAGIETLIEEMGGRAPDRLYLAGGFGQRLDADSAFATGLLPETVRSRVVPIGNSSLAGAALAAADTNYMKTAARIAAAGEEIVLAAHPRFNELFMAHMMF
jgi:uncharacterized 2Fe-2S/4Fe-4S cluster protein (DUF4445 family)